MGDVALDKVRYDIFGVGDWNPVFRVFWVFVKSEVGAEVGAGWVGNAV